MNRQGTQSSRKYPFSPQRPRRFAKGRNQSGPGVEDPLKAVCGRDWRLGGLGGGCDCGEEGMGQEGGGLGLMGCSGRLRGQCPESSPMLGGQSAILRWEPGERASGGRCQAGLGCSDYEGPQGASRMQQDNRSRIQLEDQGDLGVSPEGAGGREGQGQLRV